MLKPILAGAAVAALGLIGLVPAAQAQTRAPAHTQAISRAPDPVPASHIMNLHGAFEAALHHVKLGKIAGIEWARGHQPTRSDAARTASSGCTKKHHPSEPNCNLVYHGGPVQHRVKLYLVLWGPKWQTDPSEQAAAAYLESFYKGLGVGPQDSWSLLTSEYGDHSGYPQFTGSVLKGVFNDTHKPPHSITTKSHVQSDIAAEADAFARHHHLKGLRNVQIVVATQAGTCPGGFAGTGCPHPGGYCAWHSYSNEPYTNLPYLLDAGGSCGEDILDGTYDGFSIVGGHEYAETITDPEPGFGTAWWDRNDPYGGEIGDKCAWQDPVTHNIDIQNITLSTGTFAVQPLFSNLALHTTGDGCSALAGSPGNRIRDSRGKCLEDLGGSFTSGAAADIRTCDGLPKQFWYAPATGELAANSLCLTDPGSGPGGTKLVLTTCAGAPDQIWTHNSKGEYVLGTTNLCLTDPHNSRKNGIQATVTVCKNKAYQHWSKA